MKTKRIAFFISSYFDGIGVNTLRLAKEFSINGYEVDVLIVSDEKEKIKTNDNKVNIIDFKQPSAYKAYSQLKRYIKDYSPDVIISGGEAPNIVLILAKLFSFKKIKIIVSVRTHLTTQYKYTNGINQSILKYLGKILYRFADEIVAVSKGVANDIARLFYLKREKIHVIYNPIVNDETFELAKQIPNHKWLTNNKIPVVIGVGRLARQKNFPLLIEAFAILKKTIDAKLLIIGEGNEREYLEQLIKKHNIQKEVELIGYVSNPYSYMSQSDVFVLSSDWEGFGNVIVEAMACGNKIVSTNCPSGPSEILDDGKYGILIQDYTKEELAKSMIISIHDEEYNPQKNIKRAMKFTVDNCYKKYKELL